ncbi:GNAT family N-acetyltransferase [Janthinobacterium sp. B9-8]|uniref:GNAT family N-acetyltransferase n=1 Tax=Janthinobacterium sp. B9-8 TaxID=1236179 RepID=UPI000B0A3ED7|nr:GNAT family N-acetyltransferase [Janthinobacterium sp. B9-8]
MSYLHIRRYQPEDALELHDLYYTSIHQGCQNDYSAEQLAGWAPKAFNVEHWGKLLGKLNPRVVEYKGKLVAYADLQSNGLINHFFVHGDWQGKGVGKGLLRHLEDRALEMKLSDVFCFISISGQAFFISHGFIVDYSLSTEVHGQWIENALMRKHLTRPE